MRHSCINLGVLWHAAVLLLSSLVLAANASNGNETDRLALLEFKAKIIDDPLGIMPLWNATTHFCQWYGVTCAHRHQRVRVLNLESLQLAGSISAHIGNLSFLRVLLLDNNGFSHGIPSEVGHLHRLRYLDLSNNSFSGKIPSNISACRELAIVYLAFNRLQGEIPKDVGLLSKLKAFWIHKNNLSGSIPPSLMNLSSLEQLSATENSLSGSIPDSLGHLKNLVLFSVGGNRLSGTIPRSVYNLSSLTTFDVSENHIKGIFPSNIGHALPNLQVLGIGANEFTGPIPTSISNATNLKDLILASNNLTGRVPFLGQLHNLQLLSLAHNQLGNRDADDLRFLSSLINSTNLEIVEINNNNFGGILTDCISNFSTSLTRFSLGHNNIHGRIPSGIANLVNMEYLGMWDNHLLGNIPINIGNLNELKFLLLKGNKLSGSIPSSVGNLTSLLDLRLRDNNLLGSIPPSLGRCRNLIMLSLGNNNLNGTIPLQVIGLSSLSIFLDLSGNNLTGVIPMEIENLINLEKLFIQNNKLSGKIPNSIGACIKLEVLNLQGNFFYGSIPSSLSSLRGIQVLNLAHNNLSGKIPEFLQGFTSLQELNLSYNNLEGMVPVEGIFKNTNATFVMGNDKLCGGIPEFHLQSCNSKQPKRITRLLKIIISIVCALLGLTFILIFLSLCWIRKKRKEPTLDSYGNQLLNVSYQSLLQATNGFSSVNLIGMGSFGSVYKGILDDGMIIAVKVFNLLHRGASRSFVAECEALKNIRHRNLVKVLTACSGIDYRGNDFKALVYEFMVNGSLEEWLHPTPITEEANDPPRRLNLLQRLNIAIDVACALDYLHHQCGTPIVHCDLKPSNVLLDNEMNGRVGDFGLARFLLENTNTCSTNQSSSIGVRGTVGYAPPEYGVGSEVSTFGDVYSYGILLLELFTGKRPTDDMFKEDRNIHNFAELASPEQVVEVADPILLQETTDGEMNRNMSNRRSHKVYEYLFSIFRIGVACSVNLPIERMKINNVVVELCSIRDKLARTGRH